MTERGKDRKGKAAKASSAKQTGHARKRQKAARRGISKDDEAIVEEEKVRDVKVEDMKSRKLDQFLSKIIEWEAEGYDVSYLDGLLRTESSNIDREFERIEKNIARIREIRDMTLDIHGVEADAQALVESLKHPERVDEVEDRYRILNSRIRLRNLSEELESLKTEGFESDARRIRDMLHDMTKVEEAERELKALKMKIKERFFLAQIKKEMKVAEPKREVMGKLAGLSNIEQSRMFVEDIFMLYHDCRFISHHTRTVRAEKERADVFKMLKAIRDFVRHGDYETDRLLKFEYGNGKILSYGTGNVILALYILGSEPSWTEAVVSKALTLMTDKYYELLDNWDGDTKSLGGLNRFVNVLMLTFERLEAKTS